MWNEILEQLGRGTAKLTRDGAWRLTLADAVLALALLATISVLMR